MKRDFFRSAKALLPRINSGAATVFLRLRRNECGDPRTKLQPRSSSDSNSTRGLLDFTHPLR